MSEKPSPNSEAFQKLRLCRLQALAYGRSRQVRELRRELARTQMIIERNAISILSAINSPVKRVATA